MPTPTSRRALWANTAPYPTRTVTIDWLKNNMTCPVLRRVTFSYYTRGPLCLSLATRLKPDTKDLNKTHKTELIINFQITLTVS
jgi:hypothetical protein